MGVAELLLVSLALSLDAFAVALSCGMRLPRDRWGKFLKIALAFGIFQAVMPLLGALLGSMLLARVISKYAWLVTFLVFAGLGGKTLLDHLRAHDEAPSAPCACDSSRCLLAMAVATSIDAFLIGSVLGLGRVNLPLAVGVIGAITFVNSLVGCFLGNRAVGFLNKYARLLAGVILLVLAVKALLGR